MAKRRAYVWRFQKGQWWMVWPMGENYSSSINAMNFTSMFNSVQVSYLLPGPKVP